MPKRKASSSASSKHHHNHNHHQQNHNTNKKNTSTSSSTSSSSSSSKTSSSKSSKKPAHINYASTDPKSLYLHPNRTINQLRFSLIVYQLILLNSRPKYYFKRYIIKIGLLGTMFSYLFISVLMAFLYYQEERYGISTTTSVNGHPGLAHLDYYLHLYMFRIGPCTLVLMLWGLLWTIFTDRLECYLTGMITPEEFVRCIPGLLVASIFTFGLTSLLPLIGGLSIESIGRFVYYLLKIDDGGGGKVGGDSVW